MKWLGRLAPGGADVSAGMPGKGKRAAMWTVGGKNVQGIKDWIRLALADMEQLCRSLHLSGEYVDLLMRQIIRERAEAALEDSIHDMPGLTSGQTSRIRQHCLDFYMTLLNEVAEEKAE